jgi:hypothetical protein
MDDREVRTLPGELSDKVFGIGLGKDEQAFVETESELSNGRGGDEDG